MKSYEKLRDRVFEDISNLRRKYSGPDLEAQKVSYLENMIEEYGDAYIEDSEGNNRTKDFLVGLHNMITDPANREVLYNFESCSPEEMTKPAFRYKNVASTSSINKKGFKVMYIPMNVEVARCLVSYSQNVATIEYLEVADDFKSQIRPSQFMSDCILVEFGFRTRIEYSKEFQGKPYAIEDVVAKNQAKIAK